jgi:16S rRNA (guanine527-N7)-methyltransferase
MIFCKGLTMGRNTQSRKLNTNSPRPGQGEVSIAFGQRRDLSASGGSAGLPLKAFLQERLSPVVIPGSSQLLREGAAELGISLTTKHLKDFELYLKELNQWRKKINLVSRKDDREIVLKDFLDSLTLVKYISGMAFLLDLGSGAGFPGFPLKIVLPDLKVFFLEATRKKVFFLRDVQRLLSADGVEIRWTAGNQGVEDLFCRFDFVVSRAFGSIQELAFAGSRFLRKGGMLVAMKGKKGREDLKDDLSSLGEMKLKLGFMESFRLPFLNHERTLIGLIKH